MKPFTVGGTWWSPGDTSRKLTGVLSFSHEDGLVLRLHGAFDNVFGKNDVQTHEILLGATDRRPYTLLGCSLRSTELAASAAKVVSDPTEGETPSPQFRIEAEPGAEMLVTTWWVSTALSDVHLSTVDDLWFETIRVEFSHLRDWAVAKNITYNEKWQGRSLTEFTCRYLRPQPFVGTAGDLIFSLESNLSSTAAFLRGITITETASFRIQGNRSRTVDLWLSDVIYPLQTLLTLATGVPNWIVDFLVLLSNEPGSRGYQVVHSSAPHGALPSRPLFPDEMLFTASDIGNDLTSVLKRWITVHSELDSVCNLYFGTQHARELYPEHTFLSLVQAIESYHRRRRNNSELPLNEHERRLKAVSESLPIEYRDWVIEKLEYSNEPRLRKRLKDLLGEWQDVMKPLVGKPGAFVDRAVVTRNYYTHFDEALRSRAATGVELYKLSDALSILMQTLLLAEIGFDSSRCTEIIRRHPMYRRTQELFGRS